MLKIVTCKWDAGLHPKKGLRFTAEHVHKLASMLNRHLHMPYELICITDDPVGINGSARVVEMWPEGRDWPGCFRRLKLFSPEMKQLLGELIVMIDLDVIITGDITPLFVRDENFVIWGGRTVGNPYCGSLFMLQTGTRNNFWEKFNINNYPPNARGRYPRGTDQNHIMTLAPNEAVWTTEDGIYNFGFDIRINDRLMEQANRRRRGLKGEDYYMHRVRNPRVRGGNGKLPEGSRLVFFNGKDDPSQLNLQEQYPWIKEYWR